MQQHARCPLNMLPCGVAALAGGAISRDPMTDASHDTAQLLNVDVQKIPRTFVLVAPGRFEGLKSFELSHATLPQDPTHRGLEHGCGLRDLQTRQAALPQLQNPPSDAIGGAHGRVQRATRTLPQAATPSSRWRLSHLATVLTLRPKACAAFRRLQPSASTRLTNSSRLCGVVFALLCTFIRASRWFAAGSHQQLPTGQPG